LPLLGQLSTKLTDTDRSNERDDANADPSNQRDAQWYGAAHRDESRLNRLPVCSVKTISAVSTGAATQLPTHAPPPTGLSVHADLREKSGNLHPPHA
jgi:hypothetical protein